MRGLILPFESFEALSLEMEAGGDDQDVELPSSGGLRDGEWVLATFAIGEESIAVAACAVDRGDGALRLALENRDWEMLWQFANADGPPSLPPASVASPLMDILAPPGAQVMVVDDDLDLQNVVGCMLRGAGFDVAMVSSAEEAFDRLRERVCDLVVLDWNLPGMTGIEFCKRVRHERKLARLPVLFLTAHSSSEALVQAFAAGADDFVSKPFRARELAARVLGLIRRSQMPPPSSRRA